MFDISEFLIYLDYKYNGWYVKQDAPDGIKNVLSDINLEYKSVFGNDLIHIA